MIKQDHLEVYDLTLTAVSPVFVGSGKKYTKKEYVFRSPAVTGSTSTEVMLLDESKFFPLLVERNLVDKYETYMLGEQTNLYRFLKEECRLHFSEIKAITRYTADAGDALDENHSLKEINAFVRDAEGRAYIPGSSLKGALRTVLLTDMVLRDKKPHRSGEMRDKGFEGKYLNTLTLKKDRDGNIVNDAVNSIMRGIMISDSLPIPDSAIMLGGKIDADVRGETHSINLCRECVKPGTKICFRLTLDRSVLKDRLDKEHILNAIRSFDGMYKDIWLSRFAPPYDAANIYCEDYILLGGGAGYISKTLTYPYLGKDAGLNEVPTILGKAFPKHHHERDIDMRISPRMDKYARYGGELYPYGVCEVQIF